jgi:hypothetical protein
MLMAHIGYVPLKGKLCVMHIEMRHGYVFTNGVATVAHSICATAIHDLELLGIKKELHGPPNNDDDDDDDDDEMMDEDTQGPRKRAKRRDVVFPAACFILSEKELEQYFKCLLGVKVSHGYSGNIGRYLDEAKKRFSGLKSHDCHVLMTQILPIAIRGIMDEHVRETLFGLCNFFNVISRKSIGLKQLDVLQEEIVVILCELEIYFPLAFFDIMVHQLVHGPSTNGVTIFLVLLTDVKK